MKDLRAGTATEPLLLRSLAAWLVMLAAMMGNGILRVVVLQPRLGEDAARQLASLSGIAITDLLTTPFTAESSPPSGKPGILTTFIAGNPADLLLRRSAAERRRPRRYLPARPR